MMDEKHPDVGNMHIINTSVEESEPILIIGAGLGGLALAHGLRQRNIPFRLFERDRLPLFRAQGYRIRIQDYYLKQLLPDSLWATFENCCGEVMTGGHRIDALSGKAEEAPTAQTGTNDKQHGGLPKPAMIEGTAMNADRRVLRNLMIEPMIEDELIEFGKRFSTYGVDEKGVVAYFADGTRVRGRLLIGADGAESLVRKQLIPDFVKLDTEGRAIFGKTEINRAGMDGLPKGIQSGLSLISDNRDPGRPLSLFCDMMLFKNRDKATKVDLPNDYIYWVLCMRTDNTGMTDEHFLNLSREFARIKSTELVGDWHLDIREMLEHGAPSNIESLAFGIAHPDLKAWKSNPRVTLLGDAAHPMTPVGGVGANAAFQDATLLLRAIMEGGSADDIATYEDTMRQNARKYLAVSVAGAERMFGMKPVAELKPWKSWI